MPGTLVTDSLASDLLTGSTLNSAGTTNGTVADLGHPCEFGVRVETGTVTGTSPTLDITVQASSTSDFSSDVVDVVAFPQIGDEDNVVKHLVAYTPKRYVRAAVTSVSTMRRRRGTPSASTTTTATPRTTRSCPSTTWP